MTQLSPRSVFTLTLLSFSITLALAASAQPSRPAPQRAPQVPPGNPDPALTRALELYHANRSSREAQRLLDQASTRFPRRYDVHLALLDSFLVTGNVDAASALLRRIQPELASSQRLAFDSIYYLLQHRRLDLAREQWTHAHARLQAKPGPPNEQLLGEDAFIEGLLAAATNQKSEAMRLLHQADSHGFPPLDSRQLLILADTFYELREVPLAVATYQEFLKHWPNDHQARLHLALALQASDQPAAAQEQLERILKDAPSLAGARYFLASILFDLKRNDEAKRYLDEELKLDPRCFQCMAKLAHIAYLAGNDDLCATWLGRAEALNPGWIETSLVAGMLDVRSGRYASAIRHLSRVVEQLPDHAQAHYQLQLAYQRSGQPEKAKEHADAYKRLTQAQKRESIRELR